MLRYRPDIEAGSHFLIKYSLFVMLMIALVIVYVWQNVEVLKIKMSLEDAVEYQKKIIIRNDKLVYEIEKLRRMETIEALAQENGMREAGYEDVVVIRKESAK